MEFVPPSEILTLIRERQQGTFRYKRDEEFPRPVLEDYVQVPRYDVHASAGNGHVVHSEQIVDYLAFRTEWVRGTLGLTPRDLALVSIRGDSMAPTLSAGDLILIDTRSKQIGVDAIYVLEAAGELRVKRIQCRLDGTVVIKSDNPQYQVEVLGPDECSRLRIVGRVVWSGRRM